MGKKNFRDIKALITFEWNRKKKEKVRGNLVEKEGERGHSRKIRK